jgi:hypothetical protein
LIAALATLALQAFPACRAQAATTERVIMNRFTGLEASQAGAVWRFRNQGNRASFVAHPEIYGPQFGGYDPIDVARGITVAGNPRFWLVSGQRLYLFSREQSRDAFAAAPARVLRDANQRWPELVQTLAQ